MVTWLSSFYLLLLKICCWRITGLSLKPIITIQPILHLGLNVTTDRTLLPLGSKCYYGWDINYAWVRLLHFCQYGGVQKLPKITTAQILVNPKSHSVIRFWALDASFSLPLNFFFFHWKVTRFISFIVDYTLLCTLNICPVLLADQSENCTASRPRAATYNISGGTTVIGNRNTVNQY